MINMQTDIKPRGRHLIESFVTRLRRARKEKGLSKKLLSKQTGVAASQISRIEQGNASLSVATLFRLARALDLEPMLIPRKDIPAVEVSVKHGPGAPPQQAYPPDWGEDVD